MLASAAGLTWPLPREMTEGEPRRWPQMRAKDDRAGTGHGSSFSRQSSDMPGFSRRS